MTTSRFSTFHEQQFLASVHKALKSVERILEAERHPVLAADEPHDYSDKFALVEFLTNTGVAALLNVLTALGLQPDQLSTLCEWSTQSKKTVTLRFLAEDACTFLKEEEVEVKRPAGEHEYVSSTTTKTTTEQPPAPKTGVGFHFGVGSSAVSSSKEETTTTVSRVVVRVKEYHWKVGARYKIIVFAGTNSTASDQVITLQQRMSETILITQQAAAQSGTKIKAPLPERTSHPPVDASLTWFLRMISPTDQTCQFAIDRASNKITPRRNPNVQEAVEFFKQLGHWTRITQGFFLQRMEREILDKDNPVHKRPNANTPTSNKTGNTAMMILEPGATGTMQGLVKEPSFNGKAIRIVEYNREHHRYKAEPVDENSGLPPTLSIKPANIKPDQSSSSSIANATATSGPPLSTVSDDTIFCPILPLMENGTVLPLQDAGDFLQEQMRTLDDALESLARDYPSRQLVKLISEAEASVVLLCKHMYALAVQYQDSVSYVEEMLKQQLIQAVGKEIDRNDFDQFMRFYHKKFFGATFGPTPFSHAIRRPGRYPDGLLSIESSSSSEPIETWVRAIPGRGSPSLFIPINAAASVEITGDRFLHGWMQHRFKSKSSPNPHYQLACRARQFSSFLVVIGTVAGPDQLDPKHAIILQNKDDVTIPLTTAVLPSAKEFKDSIRSLSPEQQEFAKAYRSMQLESSVFGVCVIQLKPQLEKLLGLPDGSLTKEIQLTQDLMTLFVDYQIPSDLLTFDGSSDSTPVEKTTAVKGYVKSVLEVIEDSKQNQLKEEEMKADMRHEMEYHPATHQDAAAPAEMRDVSEKSKGLRRRLMKKPKSPEAGNLGTLASAAPQSMLLDGNSTVAFSASSMVMQDSVPPPAALQVVKPEHLATAMSPAHMKSAQAHHRPQPPPPPDFSSTSGNLPAERAEDFTLIPKELDAKLDKHDNENALRSTIITAGSNWGRIRQESFLTGAKHTTLSPDAASHEKKKAFDLLDAISRSGTLAIECSEFHVVVAVSHCFDKDILETIIQDNINPISKLERSSLLLASTIYGQPAASLIRSEQDVQRLRSVFPLLLEADSSSEAQECNEIH